MHLSTNAFHPDVAECIKYELKSDQKLISVKGRLRRAYSIWKDLKAPQFILDVIQFGYKLPFIHTPSVYNARNNKSALAESVFVEQAINELSPSNCISEVSDPPDIVNPLSVSIQKSGKKRLILDLRHVNKCIYKNKFR